MGKREFDGGWMDGASKCLKSTERETCPIPVSVYLKSSKLKTMIIELVAFVHDIWIYCEQIWTKSGQKAIW